MKTILTPTEMGEADRRTIAAGTPAAVLMDRAGRAVAWRVRELVGGRYGRRAVIVCGRGNNGGDGHVVARVLTGWGMRIDRFDLEAGVDLPRLDRALDRADVLIDAMYGTGFRGALSGAAAEVARRSADHLTVAVDIPSGVDGVTGLVAGEAVRATATVTFQAHKPGLVFEPGHTHAGDVTVADIGIDTGIDAESSKVGLVDAADVAAWLPQRAPDANKWQAGLLVVGGSGGMTGAPLFVSHAGMRAGAGIVWCAVPGAAAAERAGGAEVIAVAMVATDAGALADVSPLLDALGRFRAVAVGPGLGTADETRAAVRELVAEAEAPMVLDADGLNAFTGDPGGLRSRAGPTVITPHAGEYARLLGEPPAADRVEATRRLAEATGCVALLKGPGTVVAEPPGAGGPGRTGVCPTGGAELATAGSGDVLTGIVGGFLARGASPFEAALAGAFVHGRAGDLAGHTGLVAGDLLAAIPRTLAELES